MPPTDPLISCVIDGRYRITQRLGAGGMGVVYAAHHEITGREVAIKVLHPSPHHSDESLARFAREARTAAATGHPNIVEVLDAGALPDGTPFLVMELLHGEALGHLLWREQRLTPARVSDVITQAAWALSALHARGVIHRDVKTDNLFVERDGRVKLLDFGLAVFTDGHLHGRVTQDGVFNGTPQYMPPEVFDGAPSVAWDVYALATVAFELLTGTVPFHDINAIVMLCTKRETVAPRLSDRVNTRFPAALERVIRRGLERDPARRHASPIDFAEDFARAVGATSERTEAAGGRSTPLGPDTPGTASPANGRRDAGTVSGWAALQVPWRNVLRAPLIIAACCAVLLATWITATRSAESSVGETITASEVLTAEVIDERDPSSPAAPVELVVAPEASEDANEANEIGAVERAVVTPSRSRRSSPPVTTVVFGARTVSHEATAIVEAARWVSMRWDDVAHAVERSAPGPSNDRQ